MHRSFKKKEETKQAKKNINKKIKSDNDNSDDDSSDTDSSTSITSKSNWGGHLQTRLEQFDARTKTMKERWYIAFAEVRQGSFLSKAINAESRQWKKKRNDLKRDKNGAGRGRIKPGCWESLPASHVQFLHWIGFDPRSSLPPPCAETAEALAFLGYDFMGKIVEKAIFLRCTKKFESKEGNKHKLILQMGANEQLTKGDIDNAMKDSTVMSKPLYNAHNSVLDSAEAVQLYFGPGFEDRIEMEMEQIVMGKKKGTCLSEKEKQVRVEEEKIFDNLKNPPVLLEGVMDLLGNEHKTDELVEQRILERNKQRANDKKEWDNLERAAMNLDPIVKSPRKRGRPPTVLVPLKK